jgi:hypothetical protein
VQHAQLVVRGKRAGNVIQALAEPWTQLATWDLDLSLLTRADGPYTIELPLLAPPIRLTVRCSWRSAFESFNLNWTQ